MRLALINIVTMDLSNKDDFLGRWLNNSLSEEERREFENSEEYAVYKKIADSSVNFNAPAYDVDAQLESVKQKRKKSARSISRTFLPAIASAAAVLIFLTFYFISDSFF